jgi:phytoene desaturase
MRTRQALVVGSGFGGLAAALRLRAKGYQVKLLERGNSVGGRARVFKQDGFTFDAGPTVITAPYLFAELFTLFGKKIEDYVEMLPLDNWYRFAFKDGSYLDYSGNHQHVTDQIAQFDQRDVAGYEKLLKLSKAIFEVGYQQLADQPFDSIWSMVKCIPALTRLKAYRSVYGLVQSHLRNPYLQRAFSMHPLLIGGNPLDTTAIYLLILFLEQKWGVHFPRGGTSALVAALEQLAKEQGVEIILNSTVSKINVSKQHITGVTLSDNQTLSADVVVYNGDVAYCYHHLLDKNVRKQWPDWRLKTLAYSPGLFVWYFGTKKQYPDIQHHTIYFGEEYKGILRDIYKNKRYNPDFSIYLHRPTFTDSSLAPVGGDSFYALVPAPNLQSKMPWDEYTAIYRQQTLSILQENFLPNLAENIVSEHSINPQYFSEELLSMHGAGFSIQPIFRQSAYFRFHNKAPDIKNLFFVGAGTHPGAGLPGVVSSAKVIDRYFEHV